LKRLTLSFAIIAAFALGIVVSQLAATPRSNPQDDRINMRAPDTNTPRAIAQALTGTVSQTRTGSPAAAATTRPPGTPTQPGASATQRPAQTIPPNTPLATLTPSRTLRPPPTIEPPTITLAPSSTPSITPTATIEINISIPGLRGAESPTPTSTAGCEPRKDWKLTYTVQRNDALINIAALYNTTVDELMKGNCLRDKNVLVIGQVLKVPGKTQPVTPEVACIPFELQTPFDGSMNNPNSGNLTFNWRGPRAIRNLIRIFRPDGSKFEVVVELRQSEVVNTAQDLPAEGWYTWYVYPLDRNFVQVCPEGGPWRFFKQLSPTLTPTPKSGGSSLSGVTSP